MAACCGPARIDIGAAAKRKGIGYFVNRVTRACLDIPVREIGRIIDLAAIRQLPQRATILARPQIAHRIARLMHAHPESAIWMHTTCQHFLYHNLKERTTDPTAPYYLKSQGGPHCCQQSSIHQIAAKISSAAQWIAAYGNRIRNE